jgi:N-methylhydantoinase A/oxoprolinase/acetone carboxylase beta subunit
MMARAATGEDLGAGRASSIRIAVDIGGTFVDAIAHDAETGDVTAIKVPTTPEDPTIGVLDATRALGIPLDRVDVVVHGTTLALNAVLERKGVCTGIVTNEGFTDVYELGRGDVPIEHMYNLRYEQPRPLVRRRDTAGVRARMDHEGSVIDDLDEAGLVAEARRLIEDNGVESIAIVFLHSYVDPTHERRAKALLKERFPDTTISISSDIAREHREYERTSTTVLDAYTRPIMERYLGSLETQLREAGLQKPLLIMRSGGGAMSVDEARRAPLLTVLSGPSGGVIGAASVARQSDRDRMITFDAGGTSLDACVIVDGEPTDVFEARLDTHPLMIPVFDIRTIGAGGGSIAWMDRDLLKVGPRSAGAVPGPIAYGRGGTEPTVTDAALCLGYLEPDEFAVSGRPMSAGLASDGIRDRVAVPMGCSVLEAAAAILDVTQARSVGALREITVERGLDPREFSLLAFGGAGPMLAPMLAREMQIPEVIIPQAPGVFSAWGMLAADVVHDEGRAVLELLDETTVVRLEDVFTELEAAAAASLAKQGIEEDRHRMLRRLDLRYRGQEYTLGVPTEQDTSAETLRERFGRVHLARHGHVFEGDPVEVVAARVRGVGAMGSNALLGSLEPGGGHSEMVRHRTALDFATREQADFAEYRRDDLVVDDVVPGPAIVREQTSVTVIHSDQRLHLDRFAHIVIETGGHDA